MPRCKTLWMIFNDLMPYHHLFQASLQERCPSGHVSRRLSKASELEMEKAKRKNEKKEDHIDR